MKISSIVILFIFATTAFAAMDNNGGMRSMPSQHQTMSGQHATQQMSQQMMNTESMRNMMTFMQQMQTSLQDMSKFMEKHQTMDQTQRGETANVMEQMSKQMHEMSEKMQTGNFDDKTSALMRERHDKMIQDMNQLEQNLQKN
ncbi:MAG: DUF4175 domain-containing protein [Gammaproteobacteria bacterium]|nr:DUF4175 domain-containing protein [Gammaproteobacteria bacterium]